MKKISMNIFHKIGAENCNDEVHYVLGRSLAAKSGIARKNYF